MTPHYITFAPSQPFPDVPTDTGSVNVLHLLIHIGFVVGIVVLPFLVMLLDHALSKRSRRGDRRPSSVPSARKAP